MDNFRFHRSSTIVDCFHRKGHNIFYLPHYSPFINLIEKLYSKWKSYTKSGTPENEIELFNYMKQGLANITREDCDENLCTDNQDCVSCIRASNLCAWCTDMVKFDYYEDYTDTRCDLSQNFAETSCKDVYNPSMTIEYSNNEEGKYIDIKPSKIKALGDEGKFNITATYKDDLPIQLMFSIDFSYSMREEWKELINLTESIGVHTINLVKLITVQKESKVGITSYVDKTNTMKKQAISSNIDVKEGTLEAVLQTAVCSDVKFNVRQIGWSSDKNILRTIVVLTDAGPKIAGDGKITTIYEPHDGNCHYNTNGEYKGGQYMVKMSLYQDYPSPGLLGHILREKQIAVIFAKIVSNWKGVNAMVTHLTEGGGNIMKLINDLRSVILKTYSSPLLPDPTSNVLCLGVKKGESVIYDIGFKYLENMTNGEKHKNFAITKDMKIVAPAHALKDGEAFVNQGLVRNANVLNRARIVCNNENATADRVNVPISYASKYDRRWILSISAITASVLSLSATNWRKNSVENHPVYMRPIMHIFSVKAFTEC
ncbi:hypothetical protein RF11_05459 [Thelohanellus kitauei]|uniref:Integrin beta n=1 Tax=Thelohanellus kitauei TaxID=669202 RepID=A0A0C2MVN2_THEKT|nr:hypothetical protein RF11_05459 [Thelohanellus kitauei]